MQTENTRLDVSSREGNLIWKVLKIAGPSLLQQFLYFIIQQYDQFLARKFSPEHQAALTTANYLYWFVNSYAVVVSAGAIAVVGRSVGALKEQEARQASAQALLLAFIFGILASVVGWFGVDGLMKLMQMPEQSQPIAVAYLRPLALVLVFQLVLIAANACFVAAADTRTGLWILIGVTLINVPLAYALSGGAGDSVDFGFTGIALGTAISHTLGGIVAYLLLARGRSGLKIELRQLLPDLAMLRRLLRVSLPAAVDSLSVALCQLWFLSLVNRLGTDAAAAHGIAIRWEAMGYLAGAGFAPATMALVSQNLGAQNPTQAARSGWLGFFLGAMVMSLIGLIFLMFADEMCQIYSPLNAHVATEAAQALRLIAFAMPAVASWIILTPALRAAGDTRFPIVISWVGFLLVRIPLGYLLTQVEVGLGLLGAWIAMVCDLYVRGVWFIIRFACGRWKHIKV